MVFVSRKKVKRGTGKGRFFYFSLIFIKKNLNKVTMGPFQNGFREKYPTALLSLLTLNDINIFGIFISVGLGAYLKIVVSS